MAVFEILITVQIIVVLSLIATILMQKSTNDGFTGGGSNSNSLMSGRGKANALSKATKYLAIGFFVNSLVLAYMSSHSERGESILDRVNIEQLQEGEATTPTGTETIKEVPEAEEVETEPAVPLAE